MATDPLLLQAQADAVAQRAADQLRELLKTVALQLRPFPAYPGAFFTYGIEVDPAGTLGGNVGCVILTDDGELCELVVGFDPAEAGSGDPVAERSEELVPVDLPPMLFAAYAHSAISQAVALLEQQRG